MMSISMDEWVSIRRILCTNLYGDVHLIVV